MKRPDLLEAARHAPGPVTAKEDPTDEEDDDEGQAVDLSSYMSKMKKDIQAKWKPLKGFEERCIVVVFSIQRDGSIVEPEIVQSSGVDEVDRSALDALHAASPVDPLPNGAPKSIRVQYKFDWHVSHQ
jgi:protein TonB